MNFPRFAIAERARVSNSKIRLSVSPGRSSMTIVAFTPAAGNEPPGFLRSAAAAVIHEHSVRPIEDRFDDRPGSLDGVLPRKQRRVSSDGVTNQPLVCIEAAA